MARWERLFEDLAAQVEQEERYERDLEIADRTRRERAQIPLLDRLAGAAESVEVALVNGRLLEGAVAETGADWFTVAGHARRWVVPVAAVTQVAGLGPHAAARDGLSGRVGLGQVLRALARSRVVARVEDRYGATLTGTLQTVAADHLDLAVHPADLPHRAAGRQRLSSIPFSALAVLSAAQQP